MQKNLNPVKMDRRCSCKSISGSEIVQLLSFRSADAGILFPIGVKLFFTNPFDADDSFVLMIL